MKIHYNNGKAEKEKVIGGIIAIQVIGANELITALLPNGKELTISLDNIEMILDDSITDNKEKSKEDDGLRLSLQVASEKEQIKKQVAQDILQDWYDDVVHGMGVDGYYIKEYAKKYGVEIEE